MSVVAEDIQLKIIWFNKQLCLVKDNFIKWLQEIGHEVVVTDKSTKIIEGLSGEYDSKEYTILIDKNILNKSGAQLEEIAQAIVREQRLVLLYTSLCTKYWKMVDGMEFIQNFLQFWGNWPHLPTQNHLVIICLNFHYEKIEPRFFWHDWFNKPTLNQEIRQVFNEQLENILQQYQLNGVVLPELNSLEQEDVKNWARKYLRECYDEIILQIRELFPSPEHRIPMEQLVRHLKQIQQEC